MGLDHLPPTGQNGTPYGESSEMDLEAVGKEASRLNISDSKYLLCKASLQFAMVAKTKQFSFFRGDVSPDKPCLISYNLFGPPSQYNNGCLLRRMDIGANTHQINWNLKKRYWYGR